MWAGPDWPFRSLCGATSVLPPGYAATLTGMGGLLSGRAVFLQDGVRVGAAESKRRDAPDGFFRPARPFGRLPLDLKMKRLEVDVRIRGVEVQAGRYLAVAQR